LNKFSIANAYRKDLSSAIKMKIIKQIATVYLFLHLSKVVHRDLKSLNILLTENYDVKIIDFGLAKKIVFFSAFWILL